MAIYLDAEYARGLSRGSANWEQLLKEAGRSKLKLLAEGGRVDPDTLSGITLFKLTRYDGV
jgi:hypothetical protein